MGAIAGIIDFDKDMRGESQTLSLMIDSMSSRGPDAAGTFLTRRAALGNRRLSVTDPAGGGQPMARSLCGNTYIIVYDGELYNAPELRRSLLQKGHSFFSCSDTEALLLSYMEWGPSCVEKLNGMFAFAVWDEKKQRVFLARDRMGVKPLFIARSGNALLFASEIKAILKHPDISPALREEGVLELFSLAPTRTAGKTYFSGIEELKPGECMLCSPLGTYVHRYWRLKSEPFTESPKDTADKLNWLITDSVKRQLSADVPVAALLLGGANSGILAAIAAKAAAEKGEKLHTFSVDFTDNDKLERGDFEPGRDCEYADIVSRHIGGSHHKCEFSPPALFNSLKDAVTARDLPGMADADTSLLLLCREVKKYATVALSGECAMSLIYFTRHKIHAR
ncbi:MAG: asparagine synthase (glutamine-hydrolyzing) [Christensenellales bacterium]